MRQHAGHGRDEEQEIGRKAFCRQPAIDREEGQQSEASNQSVAPRLGGVANQEKRGRGNERRDGARQSPEAPRDPTRESYCRDAGRERRQSIHDPMRLRGHGIHPQRDEMMVVVVVEAQQVEGRLCGGHERQQRPDFVEPELIPRG